MVTWLPDDPVAGLPCSRGTKQTADIHVNKAMGIFLATNCGKSILFETKKITFAPNFRTTWQK